MLDIHAHLARVANEAIAIAALWHVFGAIAIAALLRGWRPSILKASVLLALPMISVAALAWAYGNPFNGSVFLAGAGVLIWGGLAHDAGNVERGPLWSQIVGWGMVAFGLLYPLFLEDRSAATYLYAAPTGVIPCPTLGLLIGLALLGGGLRSLTVSLTLAALGLFYGIVGVLVVGVGLDILLVAGAVALATVSVPHEWTTRSRTRRASRAHR